jgi:hypothetical protein
MCTPLLFISHMTTSAITPVDNSALLAEFSGGTSTDVSMMIGIGLVKDSEAVFFQYLGDEQTPSALMMPSGRPLTRLANVTLAGIDVADDIGEFKSTKLNLFLQSSQGRVVMLTSGLTTIWSQCVLNALMGLYNSYDLNTPFQLDSWKGTSKMRPCFAAVRIGQQKVSDQELYDLLTDARGDRDSVKVEQLCRNAVATIRAGLGVTEPVDVKVEEPAVDPEAAELF